MDVGSGVVTGKWTRVEEVRARERTFYDQDLVKNLV